MGITIRAVNDAPSFAKGVDQNVADNAGPQQVSNWAKSISKGPSNEYTQSLSFDLSYLSVVDADGGSIAPSDLFSVTDLPAIDPTPGHGHLTYTPKSGAKGTAEIRVTLQDDGQTEKLTGTETDPKDFSRDFTIIVQPFPEVMSIPPAPDADNVPTGIYLELGFSQPMNRGSILASRLTITDV